MSDNQRERFNLETMSGVFPGTRTQVFQRVVLGDGDDFVPNAQVAWYDDPAACVVTVDGADEPLLRVEATLESAAGRSAFWADLLDGLGLDGVELDRPEVDGPEVDRVEKGNARLRTCGTCAHCQETAAVTVDGLALGVCNFGADAGADQELARQSLLGLVCVQWQRRAALITCGSSPDTTRGTESFQSQQMGEAARIATGAGDRGDAADHSFSPDELSQNKVTQKKVADDKGQGGLVSVFKRLFERRTSQPELQSPSLVEKSGVGAGTESCFACQGRIANLGAWVAQTDEGDAQTFSVWRCRVCYTFYLNKWIDRWERLDNLETEEVYYRLAPSEAMVLLQEIDAGNGSAQKFMDLLAERSPLSHQIKHGR